MIRITTVFVLFFFTAVGVWGQKVKYKDLFVLLNASQFETAEPHLKRYLKENNDNPNAFYYMGVTYQEKAIKNDPLVQTEALLTNIDSALYFFDLAYKGIDERELKKNDEYYESFSRRDIRTGKFTVKLSDIQLQLEDRVKGLKERSNRIKSMKKNFLSSERTYLKVQEQYKAIADKFDGEKEFWLSSDESVMDQLKNLATQFDSVQHYFTQYKNVSQLLGKTGHNQILDLQEIREMKRDGASKADFMQDALKIWDYKSWAIRSMDIITKEIVPSRSRLVSYDIAINKLRDKQKADSVSVKRELEEITSNIANDGIRKFDPDPLPMAVFAMNIAELTYSSEVISHKKLKDSTNVKQKLDLVKSELILVKTIDSLARNIEKRNLEKEGLLYNDFVTKTYGTLSVLKSNARATSEYAIREKLKREKEWEKFSQALKWVVSGADSIPLFSESGRSYSFRPIVIVPESHTAGLKYADTVATGYLYNITPTRIPEVKSTFPVDADNFKKRNFPLIKGISSSENNGQIYFVLFYSEGRAGEGFPATLAKIYKTDGLAWSANLLLEALPTELHYTNDTGEVSIKITTSGGESKIVLIDKNGKQI